MPTYRSKIWRSTAFPSFKDASPQLKVARSLLKLMPKMEANEFKRRLQALRASDLVEGPLALHWLFSAIARAVGPGKDRVFFLEQADVVMEEAVTMRKLKKGHSQYEMSPWDVVHWKPPAWIPRYSSCPLLPSETSRASMTVQPVS